MLCRVYTWFLFPSNDDNTICVIDIQHYTFCCIKSPCILLKLKLVLKIQFDLSVMLSYT